MKIRESKMFKNATRLASPVDRFVKWWKRLPNSPWPFGVFAVVFMLVGGFESGPDADRHFIAGAIFFVLFFLAQICDLLRHLIKLQEKAVPMYIGVDMASDKDFSSSWTVKCGIEEKHT